MFVLMFIKDEYRHFLVQLQKVYALNESTVITDWVFEKLASLKRSDILKNPENKMKLASAALLKDALQQLLQHKPVQYVLQEAWFYNLKMKVNEHVLIPRPETEELVEQLIRDRKSKLTDPAILDIGTGSGCIPIAIKKNLPAAIVSAVDISEKAIAVAKENAATHNAHISFFQTDFLDESNWSSLPVYDVIISNPPYIPEHEKENLSKSVRAFEPQLALFVADDSPLIFYEKIAIFGTTNLQPLGRMYLETHEAHAQDVAAIFRKDYQTVMVKKDIYGKERMVLVTA